MAEPLYLDLGALNLQELKDMANGTEKDRADKLKPLKGVTKEQVLAEAPLTFTEHLAAILLLAFGPPNGVFSFPAVLFLVGYFIVGNVAQTFLWFGVLVLAPLALIPQPYIKSSTESWLSWVVIKYFSAKFITEQEVSPNGRHIYVGKLRDLFYQLVCTVYDNHVA